MHFFSFCLPLSLPVSSIISIYAWKEAVYTQVHIKETCPHMRPIWHHLNRAPHYCQSKSTPQTLASISPFFLGFFFEGLFISAGVIRTTLHVAKETMWCQTCIYYTWLHPSELLFPDPELFILPAYRKNIGWELQFRFCWFWCMLQDFGKTTMAWISSPLLCSVAWQLLPEPLCPLNQNTTRSLW